MYNIKKISRLKYFLIHSFGSANWTLSIFRILNITCAFLAQCQMITGCVNHNCLLIHTNFAAVIIALILVLSLLLKLRYSEI